VLEIQSSSSYMLWNSRQFWKKMVFALYRGGANLFWNSPLLGQKITFLVLLSWAHILDCTQTCREQIARAIINLSFALTSTLINDL
jgi:hypothetical protein